MAVERWKGGKWRARWRDDTGRTMSKVFDKKALAEAHITAMRHSVLSGSYIDPNAGKISFEDYAEEWCARQVWRPSTEQAMRYALERAFDVFGSRSIKTIKQSDVQKFVRSLGEPVVDDAGEQVRAGLAPSTIEGTYRCTAMVFRAAVLDHKIPASPCVSVRLPKVDRPKVKPLESAEVFALADAISPRLRALVLFCACSGLRISEALGVRVSDVDFLRKTVRVDHQLVGVKDGAPSFGPCKTVASNRVVPIGQAAVDVLAAHLAEYPASGGELIFTNDKGAPWVRNRANEAWASARTKAKVEARGWHDLRHHFASVLIGAGCSIKAVQEALGHANASETLDCYSHLWPSDEDRIRDAVDAVLGGSPPPAEAVG